MIATALSFLRLIFCMREVMSVFAKFCEIFLQNPVWSHDGEAFWRWKYGFSTIPQKQVIIIIIKLKTINSCSLSKKFLIFISSVSNVSWKEKRNMSDLSNEKWNIWQSDFSTLYCITWLYDLMYHMKMQVYMMRCAIWYHL